MRAALCPETWVLLLSAGGAANDAAIADLLTRGCDWERLTRAAAQERAAVVLWPRVGRVLGTVPPAAEPLRRLARVSAFQQTQLRARLLEVLDLLETRDLRPVLLKGAALASTTYATFAERPMADLDLLFPAERVGEAAAALRAAGWRWTVHAKRQAFYARHHHIPPLEDEAGVQLELHTALFPPGHAFRLPPARILSAACEASVEGRAVLVLSPEHQLLHTCLHFAWSHALASGAWATFRDIGALLEAGAVDWSRVPALCRSAGGELPCFWTFRLARSLSGIPVPEETLQSLRPPLPTPINAVLERHFALQLATDGRSCPSVRLARALWYLGCVGPRRYGGLRPWDMSEAFTDAAPAKPVVGSASVRQRRLRRWRRYLAGEVY